MHETQHTLDTLVSHGEVDKTWQFINHGVTAAAKKHFSGKQRRGKYQASPDTTALARQKQVYRSQLTQTCCGTLTHARQLFSCKSWTKNWLNPDGRISDGKRRHGVTKWNCVLLGMSGQLFGVYPVRLMAQMWVLNLDRPIACNVPGPLPLSGQST